MSTPATLALSFERLVTAIGQAPADLAAQTSQAGVSQAEARELRRDRLIYSTYPQIQESLTPESQVPFACRLVLRQWLLMEGA